MYPCCSSATDAAAGPRGRAIGGHRVPHGPDVYLLILRAAAAAAAGAPAGAAAAHAPADPDGDDAAASIGAVRGTHADIWCE